MQSWKTMMAATAAMLISVGSAHAVEQVEGATGSARPATSRDARGADAYDAAQTKAGLASGEASGFVTRDELEKDTRALIERLDRERNAQVAAPAFTDAG